MRTEHDQGRGASVRAWVSVLVLAATLLWSAATSAFYRQEGTLGTRDDRPREVQNREYFTERSVITHKGEVKRFYSDILKDRVVLIQFFYTNCPTAEQDTAKLAEILGLLDRETGMKVTLVSVSADPDRDTPEAVKDYAERYRIGKGWVLLTGGKETLTAINRKLGNASPDPESHIRVYLLGNLKTGHWIRMNQYSPSPMVADGLRQLASE